MHHLTLDLDDSTDAYCGFRSWQLKAVGSNRVMYRLSSGGSGYHIRAFFPEGLNYQEVLEVTGMDGFLEAEDVDQFVARFLLGDDPDRVYQDMVQSIKYNAPTNTLADDKGIDRPDGSTVVRTAQEFRAAQFTTI